MVELSELVEGSSSSDSKYDVFLSFRGADTRYGFTDHLYKALVDSNFTTFLDDNAIGKGEELKPELEKAIKSSRSSIIVVSKNYASSRWCLDELVLILEQRLISDHIVIPIFYHVEPTDVRNQQKTFKAAMDMYKKRMDEETNVEKKTQWAQKIDKWKQALRKVGELNSCVVNGRKETDLIEDILRYVDSRLGGPSTNPLPLLFGMDDSIAFITSWLKDASSQNGDILTIYGMGGIGKTSLARYVHMLHSRFFEKCSFVEGIGAKCASEFDGLLNLQKQLCGDILKRELIPGHNIFINTSMIENVLKRKRVFLVLDDIDSVQQLHTLLGNQGFYPGSKIIVTTKDVSLTDKYAPTNPILPPKHTKLSLEGLDRNGSLQLLSKHAFMSDCPKKGYEEVSGKILTYCVGHPLALIVLGESLHNEDITVWEDCIEVLKKEPDSRIRKALEMSFHSLPLDDDKELFKHIACFFVRKEKGLVQTILNACDLHTTRGIKNLINRCLLTIGPSNKLMMHQLLQEMGKDVVRQESPKKQWMRSRLWCHKDSFKVLKKQKGTENIEGLILDMKMLEKEKLCGSVKIQSNALSNMDNLMLLQLNYVQLLGSYKHFPHELRWLCMHGFPLKFIPLDLPVENLVVLDMSYSSIESFGMCCSIPQPPAKRQKRSKGSSSKDKQFFGSLKILDLSFCEQLGSIGGFFELPALEKLILANCRGLNEVCESIERCTKLDHVDLSYCIKLEKLATTIGKLKKAETLILDGCNFTESQTEMRDMVSLEMIKDNNDGMNTQTSSSAIVEGIPSELKSLIFGLPSLLVRLSFRNGNLSNESFPMDFNSLQMLKELYLDGNPIVSMPNCVRTLPKLQILSMEDCELLKTVDHPPHTLRQLALTSFESQAICANPLSQVMFDRAMSPLELKAGSYIVGHSSHVIEGMVEIQPMTGVKENVLGSLGWTNIEFIKDQHMETWHISKAALTSQVQMYYEFGIFSTIFSGNEIPNWINHRSSGSSVSFTISSSPKRIRGLNFCCVQTSQGGSYFVHLPLIKMSNITKKETWIYYHCIQEVRLPETFVMLSHWMFTKNEMEDGDEVTISLSYQSDCFVRTSECGISLVYDDGSMEEEEDVLGYYKSWNHIIGGDLSAFQTTTGEYILDHMRFFWNLNNKLNIYYLPIVAQGARYKEINSPFRAFSQMKSNIGNDAPEVHFLTPNPLLSS